MKLLSRIAVLILGVALLPSLAQADETPRPTNEAIENLQPFPEKMDGMDRFVIYMEPKDEESTLQVELIPGKLMEVDCNHHKLMGDFAEKELKGWGYTYFTFETKGVVASTLKACPGPKSEKFVAAGSVMSRYNSRLPLVVYIQQGYTLHYRIWSAGAEREAVVQ